MSDEKRRERRINTIVFLITLVLIPVALWGATALSDAAFNSVAGEVTCAYANDPGGSNAGAGRDPEARRQATCRNAD